MDHSQSEGMRRSVNLSTLMLQSLKAERYDFQGGKSLKTRIPLVLVLLGTVNSKLKIAQKNRFAGKRTTIYHNGKVVQRSVFNID